MKKIFLLLVLFLFFPEFIFASGDVGLKVTDENKILQSLIPKVTNEWIEVSLSNDALRLQKQAILVLLRRNIQFKVFNSILDQAGSEGLKWVMRAGGLITSESRAASAVDIFETLTVQAAKDYALDWFSQNEIKTGNGNFVWEGGKFPYIIVYKETGVKGGDAVITIYSSKEIKAPPQNMVYEWEGGIEIISPFILEIKGQVQKTDLGAYSWVEKPNFNFIFGQPVPEFDFKETSFWEEVKTQAVNSIKDSLGKIKDLFAWVGFQDEKSSLVEAPVLSIDLNGPLQEAERYLSSLGQNYSPPALSPSPQIETIVVNNEEQLDKIKEQINDLAQKLADLEKLAKNIELPSVVEKPKITTARTRGGVGSPAPSYCHLDDIATPPKTKIIFNSIGWNGNEESANNEWIELKNVSGETVNLSGWQVLDKDMQIKIIIPAGREVSSGGVFLMERTDDNSVQGRRADYIYAGALNNENEILYLFDGNCGLQDRATNSIIEIESKTNQETTPLPEEPSAPEEPLPPKEILINEIAWMGTRASSNDEWIELYNPNSEPVNLTGWTLSGSINLDFSIKETATPTIDALGYFLLERTDDTSVSDIKADYIYTGALNDEGGLIELKDSSGNLVDKADFSSGWPAGDKENRISMERADKNTWETNNFFVSNGLDAEGHSILGTPRAKNSVLPGIYIINGEYLIPEGKTLVLKPGTTLKFKWNSKMTIAGTLKANGTEDKKIVFTSAMDNPNPEIGDIWILKKRARIQKFQTLSWNTAGKTLLARHALTI